MKKFEKFTQIKQFLFVLLRKLVNRSKIYKL